MKVTFKKVDAETWVSNVNEWGIVEAEIKHVYFGMSDWYKVYVYEKLIGQEDKLADAKALAKWELGRRKGA